MARLTRLIVAALAAPVSLAAQAAPKITIDSVLRALRAGDSAIDLATADPLRHYALDSMTIVLRELRASDLTVDEFVVAASAEAPGFLDIFRWDRTRTARVTQPALRSSLFRLQQIVMPRPNGLGPRILARLDRSAYDRYVGGMEALNTRAIQAVQAASTDKLRRYEIKFGPGAPRLNPIETAANYLLERIPGIGFGPRTTGPGPLEMIAAYSNTDITSNAGVTEPRVVSAAHAGLRIYTFDTTSTRRTLGRLLHPATISLGGSAFAPTDRPLTSPIRSGRRWGGFIQWGDVRLSAALGKNWRALIGSGAQLIPHLF